MEMKEDMEKIENLEKLEQEPPEPWYKGPIKYIMMTFILLLIVMWYFPKESIKLDSEPARIPTIEEVLPPTFQLNNQTTPTKNIQQHITPNDPIIKQIANKIATTSCDGSQVCQAKAIYYFVRDNIEYVADPLGTEYWEDPKELLTTKGGDCESGVILLSSLLGAIGIDYDLVFIPNHVFLKIRLDNALKRYKIDDYIYLDWTCKTCAFGEIPLKDRQHINQ